MDGQFPFASTQIFNVGQVKEQIKDEENEGTNEASETRHMFQTSICIDWDNRRSIHNNQQFIAMERNVDVDSVESNDVGEHGDEHMKYSVITEQRDTPLGKMETGQNLEGVTKFRGGGRYKYQYCVDVDKVAEEVLKEQKKIRNVDRTMRREDVVINRDLDGAEEDYARNAVIDTEVTMDNAVIDSEVTMDCEKDGNVESKDNESSVIITPGNRAKLRSKGIMEVEKKNDASNIVRRKRRDRIDSSQFRLTDYGSIRNRTARQQCLPSEEIIFKEACRVACIMMGFLDQKWIEVPHLRCVHIKDRGRKMISLCSSRCKEKMDCGAWKRTISVGLMSEAGNKTVICVNFIAERKVSWDGAVMSQSAVICCSCDVRRVEGKLVDSECVHTEMVNRDDNLMKAVKDMVRNGVLDDGEESGDNRLFGAWIILKDGNIIFDGVEEDAVICTQLDQVNGREMTARSKNIARRWSCWNVYDVQDKNFICCIRSALGSGIAVTKMKCVQCRLGPRRKCRHETGCMKVLSAAGTVSVNDNGEMQEVEQDVYESNNEAEPVEAGNSSCSEYSRSEYGSESEEKILTDAAEVVNDEDDGVGKRKIVNRKCIEQPKTFMSSWKMRQLYMCRSERNITGQLTDFIEKWNRNEGGLSFVDPDGSYCEGTVLDEEGRKCSCNQVKISSIRTLPRKVTLLTLNHDIFSVVLNDWICPSCGYENRYNGEAHGIYPAARHRAFTVELVYFWMNECMERGISFRSVFDIMYNLQNTPSYRRKFKTKRLDLLAPEYKRDRRLGNHAMRWFCEHIDLLDESASTMRIFSCSNCEIPMEQCDFQQLGLDASKSRYLKRFKSIVMDGKVIGSLREFPIQHRNVHELIGAKGMTSKLINNRDTRNALKFGMQSIRVQIRAVEYGRSEEVVTSISENNGTVSFRIGAILDVKGVTKTNYQQYLNIFRWYCERHSCLCTGSSWTPTMSHERCSVSRESLAKRKGCSDASRILNLLFKVGADGSDGVAVKCDGNHTDRGTPERNDFTAPNVYRDSDEESQSSSVCMDDDVGRDASGSTSPGRGNSERADVKDEWVSFRIEDSFKCTELLESLLENIQFSMGEPITLGFLPFFVRNKKCGDHGRKNQGTDNIPGSSHDTEVRMEKDVGCNDRNSVTYWDEWSVKYLSLLTAVNENESMYAERLNATKTAMIDMLTKETEELHAKTSTALLEFCFCRHKGTREREYPCSECTRTVEKRGEQLQDQNAVLSYFLSTVSTVGKRAPLLSRSSSRIVHELIDLRISGMHVFKKEVVSKMDQTVWKYWGEYGHFDVRSVDHDCDEASSTDDESTTALQSEYVFPGRQQVRPTIRTDCKDKTDCTKKYGTSRPNMTSFISLQCSCAHPKIVGFSLIKEAESLSMAISTVIAYLRFPPRVLWYDKACNFYDSALLRTPFLLRFCLIIVDRFHYQGHTCSNQFNADRYKSLVGERSVSAEVMNAVMERSASFIRYLKGGNIKPYLKVLFAMHNFKSMLRDETNRKDLPLLDLGKEFNARFTCKCCYCLVKPLASIFFDATINSVGFKPIHTET